MSMKYINKAGDMSAHHISDMKLSQGLFILKRCNFFPAYWFWQNFQSLLYYSCTEQNLRIFNQFGAKNMDKSYRNLSATMQSTYILMYPILSY